MNHATTNESPAFAGLSLGVIIALLATYIIWGTTYLAIRFVVEDVPPFLMAGTRFLIAGGLMFAFLRARGQRLPNLDQWRSAGIVALFMLGGGRSSCWAAGWALWRWPRTRASRRALPRP